MNSFYSDEELAKIGFKSIGKNLQISRKASFYGTNKISIGNNVRIDDFCVISGSIAISNYVHIASHSCLYGGEIEDEGIHINNFVNISSRVNIYSINDDYSGENLPGPFSPPNFRKIVNKKVLIDDYVIIGCGCVILPGCHIKEGSAFGSMSFINKDSSPWSLNIGIPFKKIKDRRKDVLVMGQKLLETEN